MQLLKSATKKGDKNKEDNMQGKWSDPKIEKITQSLNIYLNRFLMESLLKYMLIIICYNS